MVNQNNMETGNLYIDVLKYLNCTLYEVRSTNRTIYLSNGNHYNKHSFHQALQMGRVLLNSEIEEQTKAFKEESEKRLSILKSKKEEVIKHYQEIIDGTPFKVLKSTPIKITFGKYKGKLTNKIDDDQYLNWLVNLNEVDVDTFIKTKRTQLNLK